MNILPDLALDKNLKADPRGDDLGSITSEFNLVKFALTENKVDRAYAVSHIKKENTHKNIAKNAKEDYVRESAIKKYLIKAF